MASKGGNGLFPEGQSVEPIEQATLQLAIAQIAAQGAAADNMDLRAMGLLGFDGALIAAAVALKDTLHHLWWLPLPGLGVSIFMCLVVGRWYDLEAGPRALEFYSEFGGQTSTQALAQLIVDLDASFRANLRVLGGKRTWFARALSTLLLTGIAIAVAWPISN